MTPRSLPLAKLVHLGQCDNIGLVTGYRPGRHHAPNYPMLIVLLVLLSQPLPSAARVLLHRTLQLTRSHGRGPNGLCGYSCHRLVCYRTLPLRSQSWSNLSSLYWRCLPKDAMAPRVVCCPCILHNQHRLTRVVPTIGMTTLVVVCHHEITLYCLSPPQLPPSCLQAVVFVCLLFPCPS